MKDKSTDSQLPWSLRPNKILRLESVNNSPVQEYQARENGIFRRRLTSNGKEYADGASEWRALSKEDVAHEMRLGPGAPIRDWLVEVAGEEPIAPQWDLPEVIEVKDLQWDGGGFKVHIDKDIAKRLGVGYGDKVEVRLRRHQ